MINVNSEISTTDPCPSCDALLRMERTASTESPRHADAHVAFRRDVSAVKTPVMLLFIENREAATGCLRGVNAELPQFIIGVCFRFSTDVFESTIDSHERRRFHGGWNRRLAKKSADFCALRVAGGSLQTQRTRVDQISSKYFSSKKSANASSRTEPEPFVGENTANRIELHGDIL